MNSARLIFRNRRFVTSVRRTFNTSFHLIEYMYRGMECTYFVYLRNHYRTTEPKYNNNNPKYANEKNAFFHSSFHSFSWAVTRANSTVFGASIHLCRDRVCSRARARALAYTHINYSTKKQDTSHSNALVRIIVESCSRLGDSTYFICFFFSGCQ